MNRQPVPLRSCQPPSALPDAVHTLYNSWPRPRGICQEIRSRRTTDVVHCWPFCYFRSAGSSNLLSIALLQSVASSRITEVAVRSEIYITQFQLRSSIVFTVYTAIPTVIHNTLAIRWSQDINKLVNVVNRSSVVISDF